MLLKKVNRFSPCSCLVCLGIRLSKRYIVVVMINLMKKTKAVLRYFDIFNITFNCKKFIPSLTIVIIKANTIPRQPGKVEENLKIYYFTSD